MNISSIRLQETPVNEPMSAPAQSRQLKNIPADTLEISSSPNFRGHGVKVDAKTAKKTTAIIAPLLGLFGIHKIANNSAEKNQEKNYGLLVAAHPEAACLLDSYTSDSYWGLVQKPHYAPNVKPYILEAYHENRAQGEKLMQIFYELQPEKAESTMQDIISNPAKIDEYYKDSLKNNPSRYITCMHDTVAAREANLYDIPSADPISVYQNYLVNRSTNPDVVSLLDMEISFYDQYDNLHVRRAYPASVKPGILTVYNRNKEQGEKLMHILYSLVPEGAENILRYLLSHPNEINKYYERYLDENGKTALHRKLDEDYVNSLKNEVSAGKTKVEEAEKEFEAAKLNLINAQTKTQHAAENLMQAKSELQKKQDNYETAKKNIDTKA